jgi:hypothetical protein
VSTSTVPPPPANDGAPHEILELVHHHPGRLRLRAEALLSDSPRATAALEAVQAMPGVAKVTHNPQTGSLLVEYEPAHIDADAIVERIAAAAGLISPFDPRAQRAPVQPSNVLIDGARDLNAVAFELTGWRADLRTIVPAALAGAAAYSFMYGKGPRLPRWDNLLWWSYSVFSSLHAKEIARRTGAPATTPEEGGE